MVRMLAVGALLASCVGDPTVDCGDHRCPAGLVCTPTSCAMAEEVAACAGKADRDACATSAFEGACGDSACHRITCGDGFIDAPEMCDDRNTADGDGCAADCKSDETCGNGVVDPVNGETCDDGSAGVSQDGCSSTCATELVSWQDVSPRPVDAVAGAAMAYDAARGRIVMFGGYTRTEFLAMTWEWDGVSWIRRMSPRTPQQRGYAAMAYDGARKQVVLFGGLTPAGVAADTWIWDGNTWTQRQPATSPPARYISAMAYDEARERIVLFGGWNSRSSEAELGDTWEWDGTTWIAHPGATSITVRAFHAMVYDRNRRRVVLVCGSTDSSAPLARRELWEWDGAQWTLVDTTGPRTRAGAAIFDPINERLMYVGGYEYTTASQVTTQWVWDGLAWASSVPTDAPPAREQAAFAFATALGTGVLFGGYSSVLPSTLGDTWTWNGMQWRQPPPVALSPGARHGHRLVFDSLRGRTVMIGGFAPLPTAGETWVWRERSWRQLETNRPFDRTSHGAAFDSARGTIVVFGGADASTGRFDDTTWQLDGATWSMRPVVGTAPPHRYEPAMAYDRKRRRIVLFGGIIDGSERLADTWELDGNTWIDRTAAVAPPARQAASMAYDERRDRIVLFGGIDARGERLGDTWQWDGQSWMQRTPATAPIARAHAAMTYDAARGRVVLFGGFTQVGSQDLWEWDGSTWTVRNPVMQPSLRWNTSLAYDARNRELIIFGGSGANALDDTWVLRSDAPDTVSEGCFANVDDDGDGLAGCADPDCWGRCTPLCPPGTSCDPADPRCGDAACSPVEDASSCPSDCF